MDTTNLLIYFLVVWLGPFALAFLVAVALLAMKRTRASALGIFLGVALTSALLPVRGISPIHLLGAFAWMFTYGLPQNLRHYWQSVSNCSPWDNPQCLDAVTWGTVDRVTRTFQESLSGVNPSDAMAALIIWIAVGILGAYAVRRFVTARASAPPQVQPDDVTRQAMHVTAAAIIVALLGLLVASAGVLAAESMRVPSTVTPQEGVGDLSSGLGEAVQRPDTAELEKSPLFSKIPGVDVGATDAAKGSGADPRGFDWLPLQRRSLIEQYRRLESLAGEAPSNWRREMENAYQLGAARAGTEEQHVFFLNLRIWYDRNLREASTRLRECYQAIKAVDAPELASASAGNSDNHGFDSVPDSVASAMMQQANSECSMPLVRTVDVPVRPGVGSLAESAFTRGIAGWVIRTQEQTFALALAAIGGGLFGTAIFVMRKGRSGTVYDVAGEAVIGAGAGLVAWILSTLGVFVITVQGEPRAIVVAIFGIIAGTLQPALWDEVEKQFRKTVSITGTGADATGKETTEEMADEPA